MNNYNNFNNLQSQNNETQIKLEKMRSILSDKEKCKEIAQKLCAYISSSNS